MREALEGDAKTPEEISKKEKQDTLIRSGKVEKFIDPKHTDLVEVSEDTPQIIVSAREVMEHFMGMPYVVDAKDAFADHRERRTWRTSLPLNVREVYEHNALRRNTIGAVLGFAEILINEIEDVSAQAVLNTECARWKGEIEKGWSGKPEDEYSPQEKIEFLDSTFKPFLVQVSNLALEKYK